MWRINHFPCKSKCLFPKRPMKMKNHSPHALQVSSRNKSKSSSASHRPQRTPSVQVLCKVKSIIQVEDQVSPTIRLNVQCLPQELQLSKYSANWSPMQSEVQYKSAWSASHLDANNSWPQAHVQLLPTIDYKRVRVIFVATPRVTIGLVGTLVELWEKESQTQNSTEG